MTENKLANWVNMTKNTSKILESRSKVILAMMKMTKINSKMIKNHVLIWIFEPISERQNKRGNEVKTSLIGFPILLRLP